MVTWHTLDAHDWAQAAAEHGAETGIRAALARIKELNGRHRAFILLLEEEAIATARALDTLPASERGPLHGVPVAIKDENDVAGTVTSFGTACNSTPKTADSLTVHLLREAEHTVTYLPGRMPDPTLPFATQFFAGLCDEIRALEHPEKLEGLHRHTLALGF